MVGVDAHGDGVAAPGVFDDLVARRHRGIINEIDGDSVERDGLVLVVIGAGTVGFENDVVVGAQGVHHGPGMGAEDLVQPCGAAQDGVQVASFDGIVAYAGETADT